MAFITGHAREGGEDELDETVTASADKNTTLVVYMGLNTLPALLGRLADAGLSPETPAAAIERGTTADQRAVYATLRSLTQASFLVCSCFLHVCINTLNTPVIKLTAVLSAEFSCCIL